MTLIAKMHMKTAVNYEDYAMVAIAKGDFEALHEQNRIMREALERAGRLVNDCCPIPCGHDRCQGYRVIRGIIAEALAKVGQQ